MITHNFVNPLADIPDFPGTKPSDWNSEHKITYPLRLGNETSYLEIDSSGSLIARNDAMNWDDVYPAAVTVGVGATAPAFTAYNGGVLKAYEFSGGVSQKELQLGFQLYHSYEEDSPADYHLHLHINNDGVGGTVIFDVTYEWDNVGATEGVGEITVSHTITLPADNLVYRNHILDFGDLNGEGKKISSVLMSKLTRKSATDTFSGSVWLKMADLHIRHNTLGSRFNFIK